MNVISSNTDPDALCGSLLKKKEPNRFSGANSFPYKRLWSGERSYWEIRSSNE